MLRNLYLVTRPVSGRARTQTQNYLVLEFVPFGKVLTVPYKLWNDEDIGDMACPQGTTVYHTHANNTRHYCSCAYI